MEIQYLSISELIPADYNPRSLSEKQFEDLRKSIEKFGELEPAIINSYPGRENIIISGHQRVKVARSLGKEHYPCYIVSLPLEKEKELNIRMNKNTGSWDFDVLANEFDIGDLRNFGFDDFELGLCNDIDTPPANIKEPVSSEELVKVSFTLAKEQADFIKSHLDDIKNSDDYKYAETFGNTNSDGNALYCLARSLKRG